MAQEPDFARPGFQRLKPSRLSTNSFGKRWLGEEMALGKMWERWFLGKNGGKSGFGTGAALAVPLRA
jgi:hypothetical protein